MAGECAQFFLDAHEGTATFLAAAVALGAVVWTALDAMWSRKAAAIEAFVYSRNVAFYAQRAAYNLALKRLRKQPVTAADMRILTFCVGFAEQNVPRPDYGKLTGGSSLFSLTLCCRIVLDELERNSSNSEDLTRFAGESSWYLSSVDATLKALGVSFTSQSIARPPKSRWASWDNDQIAEVARADAVNAVRKDANSC